MSSRAFVALGVIVASSSTAGRALAQQAPTVIHDSIYSLAVDSTAYRQYAFVYLLDDGVVRFDADGKGSRTYHQVIQILKPSGVARWAEQSISYQPDREKAYVNWMRVVRPSGEVISEKPVQSQSSDVPASMVDPVYTETKVIRYSLSNVAPGTLVDLSWTIETTNPPMPGDLTSGWSVSLVAPGMRSRFVLDVPSAMKPTIVERHLDFARTEVTHDGRHVYTWARQNVMPPKSEMFAPDSSVPSMSIGVTAPMTWGEIGKWYNTLSHDRYALTPALTASIDSIVRPARTADDTIEALHRWIARDLRYVSISLGIGGYQPRFPAATVGTGYGDCKDKATLFIAAARHFGFTAFPVLLNSFGGDDRSTPSVERFNHVIAAIRGRGGQPYTYLDLTTDDFTGGEIPPSYQGGFGLVVLPDGSTQEITFPKAAAPGMDERFVGEMTADGKVSGEFSVTEHGAAAVGMRAAFTAPIDSARRASLKRQAPRIFPGASIDTVILPDFANRSVDPTITYRMSAGDGAKPAGSLSILSVPGFFRGPGAAISGVIDELQRADPRKLPIDAGEVLGEETTRQEIRLTLPPGWTAQLPDSMVASGPFGTVRVTYAQVGRELRMVRSRTGSTAVLPPSAIGALIEFFQQLRKDDTEFIPIAKGG